MRLSHLLQDMLPLPAEIDRDINRLVLDSRHIQPGDLFFAIQGSNSDGRKFVSDAVVRGAAAILVDGDAEKAQITYENNIPLIPALNLRQLIGPLAARFYANPAQKLCMIGITGTNGKTSCSHFIAQALQRPCGVIGTLGSGLYGALGEPGLTTPDAITLQSLLGQFVKEGAEAVAMEVSSHSIDQGRVNGVEFDISVFTNLTQDHLDYHGSMAAYAAVKYHFLADLPTRHVVLNVDDHYGRQWLDKLAENRPVVAYSCEKREVSVPLVYADQVQLSLQGINAVIHSPWGNGKLDVPLMGRFNLSNILAVLSVLCLSGIPFEDAIRRLHLLRPVPGRMQAISAQGMPLVVVDYAHTPDALEKVLETLRLHCRGQLICVFGCGGDRDSSKRPLMAKLAENLADKVIVTNDNPRHEKPEDIAEQILQGFARPDAVSVLLDRSQAIQNSIQYASADDCILIAGKGAEHYQQVGDIRTHFDDVEEVKKCMAEKLHATVVK